MLSLPSAIRQRSALSALSASVTLQMSTELPLALYRASMVCTERLCRLSLSRNTIVIEADSAA
jgi:hypothetical protein